jgi:membrane-bound serine protease (ClpP class)
LTAGGITAMILGAMMLVDAPVQEMRIAWTTLLPVAVTMAAWTILIVNLVLKAQRRHSVTGQEGLIRRSAVAETELALEGWVRVAGERWMAVAETYVAPGDTVTVTSVDGLKLHVRKGE